MSGFQLLCYAVPPSGGYASRTSGSTALFHCSSQEFASFVVVARMASCSFTLFPGEFA